MKPEADYSEIIKKIAEQENVSEEYVYMQLQQVIIHGMNNPEPSVQEFWRRIAPNGEMPTPENLIEILTDEITSKHRA